MIASVASKRELSTAQRRERVLDAALLVFGRYGFQKSSMEQVANAAKISRPRLYYHFANKQDLFYATVKAALDDSLASVKTALAGSSRPLADRLVQALDEWQGRFVGHIGGEIGELIAGSEALLGGLFAEYAARFTEALTEAITAERTSLRSGVDLESVQIAQVLHTLGNGFQREAQTRDEFIQKATWGVSLVCGLRRSRKVA